MKLLQHALLQSAAVAALAVTASAQTAADAHGFRAAVATGVDAFAFSDAAAIGLKQIALSTTTLSLRAPLLTGTSISTTARFAVGSIRRADGTRISVAGPTDTEVQLGASFGGRTTAFGVAGLLVLPTGLDGLDDREREVAGLVASDLLPFRISHWGSGGGVGMNLSFHCACGGTGIGGSASYLAAREYEPFSELRYRPGNELQLRANVSRPVGDAGKLTLDASVQRFATDAAGGQNLFQPGNRYRLLGSFSFPAGARASGLIYASALRRAAGAALSAGANDIPLQDLWLAGGGLRIPRGGVTMLPSVDARVFRSADGVGQGYLAGAALALEWVRGSVTTVPSLRARLGRVVATEEDRSLVYGADLGVSLRFGSRRSR